MSAWTAKKRIASRFAVSAVALTIWLVCGMPASEAEAPVSPAIDFNPLFPSHLEQTFPTADVLIDAGHGGIDSGTLYGDTMEKDINLAIARKLYLILRSHGVKAVLNRTGDYALSDENRWHRSTRHKRDLSQRGGLTYEIDPDMFVSIHVNWAKKKNRRGPLVIHQNEARSALLGGLIQEGLNRQQNTQDQPQPGGSFYVLRKIKVPSVIVETGFLSHAGDREMLTSPRGQTRVASAIAAGIMAYRCIDP